MLHSAVIGGWISLFICLHVSLWVPASTLYSRSNGNWSSSSTWSTSGHGGASCGCTPGSGDIIVVGNNHFVSLTADLQIGGGGNADSVVVQTGAILSGDSTADVEVRSTGKLKILGSLAAYDITFYNGSKIYIGLGGSMTANNDFVNRNNSDEVEVNGSIQVENDFTGGNGSVITGSGTINVEGTATQSGDAEVFGCTPPSSTCCSGGSDCTYNVNPIPVVWRHFKAVRLPGKVKLQWGTVTEINNREFIVERSADGMHFQPIGSMQGAGNTLIPQSYEFIDATPLQGYAYYRLLQVDFNAKSEYSRTLSVSYHDLVAEESVVKAFPNPVQRNGILSLKNEGIRGGKPLNCHIYNSLGREVAVLELPAAEVMNGACSIQLPAEVLPGYYYIRISQVGLQLNGFVVVR